MRPAVFLDRDGTIIEHVDHLTDPGDVRLIPGAAKAIRLLRSAGYVCVVVTNQSVIGRGMLSVEGLGRVHAEMRRQLAQHGAELDGVYYCPAAPTTTDRTIVEHSDRKPGSGMLLRSDGDGPGRVEIVDDRGHAERCARRTKCGMPWNNPDSETQRSGAGEDDQAIDLVAPDLGHCARLIVRLDATGYEGAGPSLRQAQTK